MKYIIYLLAMISSCSLFSQDVMTLSLLRQEAENNYPNLVKGDLLQPEFENTICNLNTGYYPQLAFGGRASWQSDVTTIAFEPASGDVPFNIEDLVTIPEMRKDNYRVTLDISQVIWDGGTIKHAKEAEKAALDVALRQNDAEIYRVGETVNDLFFSLLMLKEREKVLAVTRDELQSQRQAMQSAIENGILAAWNNDALQAEILMAEQQIEANTAQMQGLINAINILTGKRYTITTDIVKPQMEIALSSTISRPELFVYDAGIARLEASEKLVYRQRMPKIAGFGQAGYGLPGLNMFSNEFEPWAMVGISFSWKPWDWKKNKRDRLNLQVNQAILSLERETVNQKFQQAAALKNAQILKYEVMIIKDEEIIAMRTKVKNASERQLEEGTMTSTAYITELNKEKQAILNREIHKIMLLQSKAEYLHTTGTINEIINR